MIFTFDKNNWESGNPQANAWLCFEGGKCMPVKAIGKHGIFQGYLNVVDGIYSVEELQKNNFAEQFFITNTIDIEVGKLSKKKHVVFLAESFVFDEKKAEQLENATFVVNIRPQNVVEFLTESLDDVPVINNKKCVLYFPEDGEINNNNEENGDISNSNSEEYRQKIEALIGEMEDNFYNVNCFLSIKSKKPYFGKSEVRSREIRRFTHLPICIKKKKRVAVIDFGMNEFSKKILNTYFNCIFCPYIETARDIFYLYEKHRIDGVIISNSLCNTDFVDAKIRKEIGKIMESKIPVLGVEFGAVLIAEILGAKTEIKNDNYCYDDYYVMNYHHKMFRVSNLYHKKITLLPENLKDQFFDKQNNICGFKVQQKKIIGYNFSFFADSMDTAFLLNEFYKMM